MDGKSRLEKKTNAALFKGWIHPIRGSARSTETESVLIGWWRVSHDLKMFVAPKISNFPAFQCFFSHANNATDATQHLGGWPGNRPAKSGIRVRLKKKCAQDRTKGMGFGVPWGGWRWEAMWWLKMMRNLWGEHIDAWMDRWMKNELTCMKMLYIAS